MEKLIGEYKIAFTKGDTYALAIKFKNISEDLRLAYFTVKENPDDEPLIQKTLGAGIDKIDDRAYKDEKTYKVQIQAGDTAHLEPRVQYLYDLQVTVDNVVKTVLGGVFTVTQSVTGVSGTATDTLEIAVDDTLEVEVETTPATNGIEYETDPVANAKIGDMTALDTTAKATLVQAINEVKNGNLTTEEAVKKIIGGGTTVQLATYAETASRAMGDGNGETIHATYARVNGRYENMPVGSAEQATNANSVNGIEFTKDANTAIKIAGNVQRTVVQKLPQLFSPVTVSGEFTSFNCYNLDVSSYIGKRFELVFDDGTTAFVKFNAYPDTHS